MRCEFCESSRGKIFIKAHNVEYAKCDECGLIYQHPILSMDEINDIYDDNYFEYEIENQDNFFNLMKLSLSDINFSEIEKNIPFKRALDIGSATGKLLSLLKKQGFETEGVEICEASANYAIEKHGLSIHKKPLEEIGFKDEYFSVVHLSHLIEHVPAPGELLKEIYRITARGGYVILTTPNASGFFAKIYDKNWRAVMPQHLWLFRKKTLSNYLKNVGFQIEKTVSWGAIPIEKNPSKIVKKITDSIVKKLNIGDVMLILCRKL